MGSVSGLFGGSNSTGGNVVSDTVSSVASSVGSFFGFAEGGKTPSSPDPSLELLTGMKGVAGLVHTNELVIPESLVSVFNQIMGGMGPQSKKSSSGLASSGGTSGLNKINSIPNQTNSVVTNTTNNETNQTTENATMAKVEQLLEHMLQVQQQQLGHLNTTSKEFTKQNKIAHKSYKKDIDSNDNVRQYSISKNPYR
jgi:hypothetical protein